MNYNRCYGCMRELPAPGAVCPRCGYDNTKGPQEQPSHVLPCGTVLNGKHVVGRCLSQDEFGITYIGYDLIRENPVCIEEYYPNGAASRSANQSRMVCWFTDEYAQKLKNSRESFARQARRASKLEALRHVVRVWDVFFENETAYIVREYIEGESLQQHMVRTQNTFGEQECMMLLTPVMEDLQKAYDQNVLHLNIKPDNILLRANGKAVLLGTGRWVNPIHRNFGLPVVLSRFNPLEQLHLNGSLGPWTDVYALCATISYLVSGKLPPSPMDRLQGEEVDLSAFSPATAEVLKKGLALKIEDRIQTMGELLAALRGVEQDEREQTYRAARKYLARGDAPELISALMMFTSLGSYRDAGKLAAECRERLEAMKSKSIGQQEGKNEKNAAKAAKEKEEMRPEERLFAALLFTLLIGGNIAGFTAPRNGKIILLAVNLSLVLLIVPMAKLFIRIAGRKSQPPDILYYSAAEDCGASITAEGLTPKHGTYVFLSQTDPTADIQKRQRGETLFSVQAGQMHSDGYVFYQTARSWKTERVPPEYLKRLGSQRETH